MRHQPRVVIIGAGGHGRVMLDVLRCQGTAEVVGFVDDAPGLQGSTAHGLPVLGTVEDLVKLRHQGIEAFVAAIGDNAIRAKKFACATEAGLAPWDAIHPSAVIAADVTWAPGVQVVAGVVVNTGAQLGNNVILNTACSVDHDCRVGDHCFIGPGARLGGTVKIEEGAFLGIGAIILPNLRVGAWSTVGAGAVVTRDVPARVVVVGCPARPVSSQKHQP
ncbi:MAG: acetyltransferase [Armatimonadetes bacterium]|nr:acetyltransferase [Armatimonadota bacterium]